MNIHSLKKTYVSNGQARVQYKDLSNEQKVVFLEKKTRMKTELSNTRTRTIS
jgi:hypothetical protein